MLPPARAGSFLRGFWAPANQHQVLDAALRRGLRGPLVVKGPQVQDRLRLGGVERPLLGLGPGTGMASQELVVIHTTQRAGCVSGATNRPPGPGPHRTSSGSSGVGVQHGQALADARERKVSSRVRQSRSGGLYEGFL